LIGAAGVHAINAHQVKTPLGYVGAGVDVTDPDTFKKYAGKVPATVAPFDGHYLVRKVEFFRLSGLRSR